MSSFIQGSFKTTRSDGYSMFYSWYSSQRNIHTVGFNLMSFIPRATIHLPDCFQRLLIMIPSAKTVCLLLAERSFALHVHRVLHVRASARRSDPVGCGDISWESGEFGQTSAMLLLYRWRRKWAGGSSEVSLNQTRPSLEIGSLEVADRFFFPRPSVRESQASVSPFARRPARQTGRQTGCWLAAECRTAALPVDAWRQVRYGGVAVRRGVAWRGVHPSAIYCTCWDAACRHWETAIILGNAHSRAFVISLCDGVCLVFIRVPAVFGVAVCLISVFLSSLVGNLKTTEWNISVPSSKLQ